MSRSPSPSDVSDTDAEDMPIVLEKIPTLAQSFKQAVIKAVEKPKYPVDSALLDRISLLCVISASKGQMATPNDNSQPGRYNEAFC